jgi:hypothetical protein
MYIEMNQPPCLNRGVGVNERQVCESRKKHDEEVQTVHGVQAVPVVEFMQSTISGIS